MKKFLFKLMELGLGLKPYFLLETSSPIFINFKLSPSERREIEKHLPTGFSLDPIRFFETDDTPNYWLSYNLYELKYPKKELSHIKKVRCEVNTFVSDATGRKGIYVFCGSPFVSQEENSNLIGKVADLAERVVLWIYGVGELLPMKYQINGQKLSLSLNTKQAFVHTTCSFEYAEPSIRLSPDYLLYNDISFFNGAATHDLVYSNSQFSFATFNKISIVSPNTFKIRSLFFERAPDLIYHHRGSLSYLVSALNKTLKESFR